MKDQMTDPPQGYEPHELPADYSGPIWIEGQLRQFEYAVRERDTALLRQALEALEKPNAGLLPHNGEWRSIQSIAIDALRERLGETT